MEMTIGESAAMCWAVREENADHGTGHGDRRRCASFELSDVGGVVGCRI